MEGFITCKCTNRMPLEHTSDKRKKDAHRKSGHYKTGANTNRFNLKTFIKSLSWSPEVLTSFRRNGLPDKVFEIPRPPDGRYVIEST